MKENDLYTSHERSRERSGEASKAAAKVGFRISTGAGKILAAENFRRLSLSSGHVFLQNKIIYSLKR